MRIIHTSDWHLGLRLHQYDMHPHHETFLNWLHEELKKQHVDWLLLSGDVFDQANPSNQALRLYYNFLHKVSKEGTKVIVTGGNHDSVSLLNAPGVILSSMGIEVRGGVPERPEDLLIPLDEHWVMAAIPFLRDKDIRRPQEENPDMNRIQTIQEGIIHFFRQMASLCKEHYPKHNAMAMGHLFMQGASTSDSERDIQIGNLAGVTADQFPDDFAYYALGHIHKPQDLRQDGSVAYSGSPLPLSFSERKQRKRLLLLETEGKTWRRTEIAIPDFVHLRSLTTSMNKLEDDFTHFANNVGSPEAPLLLDIHIEENEMRGDLFYDLNQRLSDISAQFPYVQVLQRRLSVPNAKEFEGQVNLPRLQEGISPQGLFADMIKDRADKDQLIALFHSVVEHITTNHKEV